MPNKGISNQQVHYLSLLNPKQHLSNLAVYIYDSHKIQILMKCQQIPDFNLETFIFTWFINCICYNLTQIDQGSGIFNRILT